MELIPILLECNITIFQETFLDLSIYIFCVRVAILPDGVDKMATPIGNMATTTGNMAISQEIREREVMGRIITSK